MSENIESRYDISIKISDDYYKAMLSIEFLKPDVTIKSEEVVKLLKDKNVTFGLKFNVIEAICKNQQSVYNEVVAEGNPHENGIDASIEYLYGKDHKIKPQVMEDGKVDFKNIGFVEIIKENEVIAVKTPATKGKSGTTVTGKVIRAKDGKDAPFKVGKNVKISEDGLSVIAECDGSVVVENDRISIIKVLEVRKDIGIETGNIKFHGQVIINGNVTDGYEVDCDGDLVINGVVEGARIKATGDVVISRGIQGHDNADIYCGRNLTSNFINSCHVVCRGDIESGAIMNSVVKCDGKVSVKGKKGLIVGGEISCKNDIEAQVIGSELGVITSIKLGVDVEIVEELKNLSIEVKELIEMHAKLDKSLKLLKVKMEQNPDDERSLFMYKKYSSSFIEMDTQLTEKRQRLKMLNELVNNIRGAKLSARMIYPGTRVKIGSSNYYVKHELTYVSIMKEKGEIVARTY